MRLGRHLRERALAARNAAIGRFGRPEVVFLGDSITEFWLAGDPGLFGWRRLNRGRSGDTTRGMRARFAADVIAHRPRAVHLMGGTNDLWYDEPGLGAAHSIANVAAMIQLAKEAGIVPIVALPPPIGPVAVPMFAHADLFAPLCEGIRAACAAAGVACVDYAESLLGADGLLRSDYTTDGVHLTPAGYRAMRGQAERALNS